MGRIAKRRLRKKLARLDRKIDRLELKAVRLAEKAGVYGHYKTKQNTL